jgi:hypothetical protein
VSPQAKTQGGAFGPREQQFFSPQRLHSPDARDPISRSGRAGRLALAARPRHDALVNAEQGSDRTVRLQLTANEALVLFEWLHRVDDQVAALGIEDPAEQGVLWDMSACLERILVGPFDDNYQQLVCDARAAVRGED